MAPSTLLKTILFALACTLPASAMPQQNPCPVQETGVTTTMMPQPTELTTTYYAATFYDGVFLNCHGFTSVTAVTPPGASATKTISQVGTVTSASYMCSPTVVPSNCARP